MDAMRRYRLESVIPRRDAVVSRGVRAPMGLSLSAAVGWVLLAGLALTLGVIATLPARAQAPPAVVRLALLPQWIIMQHRGPGGALTPDLRAAIDGGVVGRTVFAWQRGVIERRPFFKPIGLVPEAEAGTLGGRGRFTLTAVRASTGASAWTEVEISRTSTGLDDVLLLEIGGERNTETQVLETLLVAEAGHELVEVPLARTALVTGAEVPVVRARFEQPIPPALAGQFHDEAGMGILVVRSMVETVWNAARTVNGPADVAPLGGGDWREGDRVFLRIPVAALERGLAGLVLGWKDRILQTDPKHRVDA
jgi:hypothetical protein